VGPKLSQGEKQLGAGGHYQLGLPTLTGNENSLGEPAKVSPESATIRFSGNVIKHPLPGNSFTVLRIPAGKTAHVPRSHEN
jgi:hypothetical protein